MKKLLLPLFLCCFSFAMAGEDWETNLETAKKKAIEENKDLFIEFTGSDWCGPCQMMKKNVLSKEEFLTPAKEKFILVELDFPRRKELPAELKEQNKQAAEKYGISGYPTVIFTNPEGLPFHVSRGSIGMDAMKEQITKSIQSKEILQKIAKAEGDEKLTLIGTLIKNLPIESLEKFYPEIAKATADDPKDLTGVKAIQKRKEQDNLVKQFYSSLTPEMRSDSAKMVQAYEDFLKNEALHPEIKQRITANMAMVYYNNTDMDKAAEILQKAYDIAPDTDMAKRLLTQKENILKNKDTLIAEMKDYKAFQNFITSLPQETRDDSTLYTDALKSYMDEKAQTAQVKQMLSMTILTEYLALGKSDQAKETLDAAIALDPEKKSAQTESLINLREELKNSPEKLIEQYKKQKETMEAMRKRANRAVPIQTAPVKPEKAA